MYKYLFLVLFTTVMHFPNMVQASSTGKIYSTADVKGSYSFSFTGQIVGIAPVAAMGTFNADGRGNIGYAVRTISAGGQSRRETFTCTYTVNPDGTGSAVCPLDDPAPGFPHTETFDFVLENRSKSFRMVGTTPGVVVLGAGHKQ